MTTQQPEALRYARWYMVNRDGMATLCTDKADAEKEAADAQSVWPHMGPHRAVQLVEAADVEAMRTGYAAARLEIESLQARIKTMAEEHADELMVAHLDGRMRAEQPAGAQQPGVVYAALPGQGVPSYSDDALLMVRASELRAFADATHALRASHGQAPAQAAPTAQPAPVPDMTVMQLAESVGLIGPASRTHDLHAAIQRFHDLICANATIKAAQMAAEAISEAAPQREAQEPVAWRELCRRLYVELFYCDQQMTSGKRPKWQQGKTVRDVLADAKAALDAAPQPTPTPQADSQPAPVRCPACSYQYGHAIGCENNPVDISLATQAAVASHAPADSVLEDAARYRWLRERSSTMFVNISINGEGAKIAATLDSAVDAARKQGGAT